MPDLYSLFLYSSLFISLFFEVFLLITYLEVREDIKREDEMTARGPKSFPSVTVIVPCFNEESTVVATVESLLKLNYPKEKLTITIVDDGSTDNTWNVVSQFKNNPQIKLLQKVNEGSKHYAVNAALAEVGTDLVGCLDADSFVTPEALRKIVPYFDDETIMAVTPSIKVHEPKGVLQRIQKTEYSWSIFLRRMLSSLGALYVTPGPFSIFRTRVFRELGGYKRAHLTEDMEMAMRMQKNHYKIVNSHGAYVYTVAPKKLSALVKQRVRWSYGFLNNAIDYRALFFDPKYGHFGMFIMPIATLSAFTSMAMVSKVIISWISTIWDSVVRYQAVGFSGSWSLPSFDWYFINTGVLPIVVITALMLTLTILFFGIKMADGKFRLSRGLFYYLFLYIFLTPLWLTQSIYKTIFRRQISWR
jgi:poly-beta-1,6-N-acetyl-D-glucosamine synthase